MSEENKIKLPRSEIQKMIDDTLAGGKYATHADLERVNRVNPGREAGEHTHKPEEFIPEMNKSFKCPDGNCGRIHANPNFKPADTYCDDCGHAFGTIDDAKKADKCPNCGSTGPAVFVSRWKGNK